MALFLLSQSPLTADEGLLLVLDAPMASLAKLGFSHVYRIDPGLFPHMAQGDSLPDFDERKAKYRLCSLSDGLTRLGQMKALMESPDYLSQKAWALAWLAQNRKAMEDLLAPARAFAKKALSDPAFCGYGKGEKRQKEIAARKELAHRYDAVKASSAYRTLLAKEASFIADHRLILESATVPLTPTEAHRIEASEGFGVRVMHDPILPLTIDQRIERAKARLQAVEAIQSEKKALLSLLRRAKSQTAALGFLSDGKPDAAPLARIPLARFEAEAFLPFPTHRIFVFR